MRIREAKIFNFGKLQNAEFRFEDGINVIYGENEQGKSTLHAFLMGMLFGLEKGRGRALANDIYTRYEPWHAPSFYSGSLRFEVEERPFYLERNFYKKEKSEYLRNEADKEELSVAYGDLQMLLGGIGKAEFANTYNIPQTGAVTGKEMAELLTTYLAEAKAGGDGRVCVKDAEKRLTAKKREIVSDLKGFAEKREQQIRQKQIELEVLRENTDELKSQVQEFEKEQRELEEKLYETEKRNRKKKKLLFSIGSFLTATVCVGMTVWEMIPLAAAICAGILLVGICIWAFIPHKQEEKELLSHAKDMLIQLKEHLQENENEIINIEEMLLILTKPSQEECEAEQNIKALELAKERIEKISEAYYLEMADELNGEISKWISLLTNRAYDSARLDEDGKLYILVGEREVLPEVLSRGTLEQIYLGLRLAVGSVLMREEDMPIFLDEAFAMYDDIRLTETLKALEKTGKQIFLFTCQKRETDILQREGIPYHSVNMK